VRKLDYHDIPLPAGVNTNFDAETQALKTLRSCVNMDTYRKFRALGKVPGSSKITANALGASVVSLHQFEYTSLAAIRTRKQIAAAGGSLFDITGGGNTTIWSSPALYAEALSGAVMQDKLFLTSENQRALVTGGVKYDGDNARRWGVVRPGAEPTVVNALDSHSGWTDSTDATTSTESTNTRDGVAAISLAKDGTSSTTAWFERASLGISFGTSVQAFVWVFLPAGMLQKLATSGTAIEVRIGGASLTNSDKHSFSVGELVPGWNLLTLALDAPDSETGTGATLTAIDTVRFTVNTAASATTFSGVLFDNLYRVDLGKPTAAVNAAGNVNGEVTYRVTFLTEYGVESNAGGASTAVTPSEAAASGTLTISGTPADGDTVTIGSKTYTFKTTLTPSANQVLIGGSAANACANLASAINGTGNPGTDYASATSVHTQVTATSTASTVVVTARSVGTGSNSIATTETGANLSFGAATLTGGQAGQSVNLTAIPTSTDPQVIARRIYRDLEGDRVYYFVDQIDDNTTTTYTDDVADASLGSATMPIAGDDLLDSSPPERMRAIAVHENRIFGISGDDPTILLVSDIGSPEQFRLIDQLGVDEELVGLRSHPLGLVLYGRSRALLLRGNGVDDPFRVDNLNTELGANNHRSIVDALGMNVVLRDEEVLYVEDPRTVWPLNQGVLDQFKAASSSQLGNAFAVHDRDRFRLLFFIGSSIQVYQYGTIGFQEITGDSPGSHPKDLRIGAWTTLSLPVTPASAALVEESADKPELWIGCTDGHVYQLQDTSTTSYANGASTAAVAASLETHSVPVGPPPDRGKINEGDAFTGRGEPRYLEINSESTSGITWSATLTVLSDVDGATLGSVSFDIACPAGKSVVCVPVPPPGVIGSWVRIALSNSSTTEDGVIRNLRLYYIGRVSRRGVRAS
jgi:hypothetical protein